MSSTRSPRARRQSSRGRKLVAVIAHQVDADDMTVARGSRADQLPCPVMRSIVDDDELVGVADGSPAGPRHPAVESGEVFLFVEAGGDH